MLSCAHACLQVKLGKWPQPSLHLQNTVLSPDKQPEAHAASSISVTFSQSNRQSIDNIQSPELYACCKASCGPAACTRRFVLRLLALQGNKRVHIFWVPEW